MYSITSSKTDQYREGSSLVIARTGTPHTRCTQEHGKVFRAKGGQLLRKSGGGGGGGGGGGSATQDLGSCY